MQQIENKLILNNADILYAAERLVTSLIDSMPRNVYKIYPIPRGGIPAAYLVLDRLHSINRATTIVENPNEADIFIDDLIDSGYTMKRYCEEFPGIPFWALFDKMESGDKLWYVFPWEQNEGQNFSAADIPTRLLQFIGEDTSRGGLKETPERFLKAWDFWSKGYNQNPKDIFKTFEDGAEQYNEMVLVKNIPVYSHCEHHLAPFFGVAHVAYIPNGRIVGLSKINRLVDLFARRLQVQERLTRQIADTINDELNPAGVAVTLECRHLCMESRGICQQGHSTTTSAMLGVFMDKPAVRAEFMSLL